MFLQKIIHSKIGSYVIAMIFGLGIASLFRPGCNGENCYEFIGPSNKKVEKSIYKFNQKCYQFQPKATTCQKQMKTLSFSSIDLHKKETNTQPKSFLTRMLNGNNDE